MSGLDAYSPVPATPGPAPVQRPGWGRIVGAVAAVWLLAGGLGWVGGRLWWQWFSPVPHGFVYETSEGLRWFAEPIDTGSAQLFSATGEYVVLGLGLGLLLGLVIGLICRDWELIGLFAALVGAAGGAYVMYLTGTALSPPDPQSLAAEAGAGAELPASLDVAGWSPYLSWPLGALIGFLAMLVLLPVRRQRPTLPTNA